MFSSIIVLTLSVFPCVATSSSINAAGGCIYGAVPNQASKFTFRIAGNKLFNKICPQGTKFDQKRCGCFVDPDDPGRGSGGSQTTVPSVAVSTSTPSVPTNCSFRENPADEFSYLENTNQGWQKRSCAKGTKFQLKDCNCILWDLVSPSCHPEVEIGSSDGQVKGYGSVSRYDVTVKARDVKVDSMGFGFNGSSEIRIDQFNNLGYKKGFTITFEFMETPTVTERQVLFTNCDNSTNKFSIEFALIPGYVKFMIDVGKDRYFAKDVQFSPGGFKKVTAVYDGKQFRATVDKKEGSMNKPGEIRQRNYPMIIGNTECPGSSGFKGTLRQIRIYRCTDA